MVWFGVCQWTNTMASVHNSPASLLLECKTCFNGFLYCISEYCVTRQAGKVHSTTHPPTYITCANKNTWTDSVLFSEILNMMLAQNQISDLSGSYWQYQSVKLCFSSLVAFAHFHINKLGFFSKKACFRNNSPFIDQL